MKPYGSQKRELIEDTEYELQEFVEYPSGRDAILINKETKTRELWVQRDDFAGYVIEINGKGFEFARSLN